MERLVFPEEHSLEVVFVIRAGLEAIQENAGADDENVDPDVREQLTKWCDEMEKYWEEEGD